MKYAVMLGMAMLGRAEPIVELTTSIDVSKTTNTFLDWRFWLGRITACKGVVGTYSGPVVWVLGVVWCPIEEDLIRTASSPRANVVKSTDTSIRRLFLVTRLSIEFV